MTGVLFGFRSFFLGLKLIRTHGLWAFVLVPSALSLLVGVAIVWASYYFLATGALQITHTLIAYLADTIGAEYQPAAMPEWLESLIKLIVFTTSFIVQLILYRTVASVLIIPFLGPLLAQVERIETGRSIEVPLMTDVKNTIRGIGVGLKLGLLGLVALGASLFLGPFQFLLNAAVQSYILGRSAFDIVFEKESELHGERRALVREHRLPILGLGLAFFLVMLVPIVGVIIAPVAGTAGACLCFHRLRSGRVR